MFNIVTFQGAATIITMTAAAITLNENLFFLVVSVLIAIVGFLIKRTLDSLQKRLEERHNAEIALSKEITKISSILDNQKAHLGSWFDDRKEIFERLRRVEENTIKLCRNGWHEGGNKNE